MRHAFFIFFLPKSRANRQSRRRKTPSDCATMENHNFGKKPQKARPKKKRGKNCPKQVRRNGEKLALRNEEELTGTIAQSRNQRRPSQFFWQEQLAIVIGNIIRIEKNHHLVSQPKPPIAILSATTIIQCVWKSYFVKNAASSRGCGA